MLINRITMPTYNQLRREMDDLFGTFLGGSRTLTGRPGVNFPAVNLWEDSECLYAEAEVPGLAMDDIEVFVAGEQLHIKGCRRAQVDSQAAYHRRERATGEFSRVISLPLPVSSDKVDATFRDGVLTIVLPKSEAARPRKITVKSA